MRVVALFLMLPGVWCASPAEAQNVRADGVFERPAEPTSRMCEMVDIAVFNDRVQIHCARPINYTGASQSSRDRLAPAMDPSSGIMNFAISTERDPALAERVLALATLATQQSKQVQIFYQPNPAENPSGCGAPTCRRLTGLAMVNR